jgi:hypothetical protein
MTLQQVVCTFFFGLCKYLALRVTGALIRPIVLQANGTLRIFVSLRSPERKGLTPPSGSCVWCLSGGNPTAG